MSTLGEARETFYDACQGLQLNSGCLAQMLSSDIGQVIVLIIGNLTPPYHKEDLQPLRSQGTQCLVMTVTPFPLPSIVSRSPLALPQGDESQKVNRMAHLFVAGIAKVHYLTLAASLGDWDRPRMSLKMLKRLPATFDISQLSPNGRDHRAASASRQLLSQLSCRHGGEKTLHLLPVLLYGSKKIHNASFGLLYRCPKLYPTGAVLIKPTTKFCHPLHTLLHPHLGHPATSLISHVHLMYPVPPINPQVVSSHISSLNLL